MDFVKSEVKNIVIFVSILAGLYFSYTYFFAGEEAATIVIGPTEGGGEVGGDILPLLQDIKKIRLDAKVFDDPIYKSLKNYSVELPKEDAGRVNPFAPIDRGIQQSSSTINIRTTPTRTGPLR